MKIIHVVSAYPPVTGGIETHVHSLATEQAKLGHNVLVITTSEKNAPSFEKHGRLTVQRHFAIRFPLFSSVRWIPFLAFRLMLEDADIYHSHGYGSLMPVCTSFAAFMKQKPSIFSLHGFPRLHGLGAVFQMLYKLLFANFFLRVAKKVISVGAASKPFILDTVPASRIIAIPNGVDTQKFHTKKSIAQNNSNTILYVGRLDKDKGIDRIINAVSIANSKGVKFRVRIVGKDESLKHYLQAQAKKLGVNVAFCEVPYAAVQNEYEDALVFVLASRYEGMSLVFMEAISCERVAFSTRVGDVPDVAQEVYSKKADFFFFNSDKELAQKIMEVSQNRRKFAAVMESARSRLEKKLSWHAVAQRTLKVYNDVLFNKYLSPNTERM